MLATERLRSGKVVSTKLIADKLIETGRPPPAASARLADRAHHVVGERINQAVCFGEGNKHREQSPRVGCFQRTSASAATKLRAGSRMIG